MPGFTQEIMPGEGDGLVANERAGLPFSTTHFVNPLNHAEVLWNVQVQATVADQLFQHQQPIPISLDPSSVDLPAGGAQRFTVLPTDIVGVTFSVDGPPRSVNLSGWIDASGTYHAPSLIFSPSVLTVRATATDQSARTATATV